MTQKSLQTIAAEWHGGQSSALYAYASSGAIQPGLKREISACFPILLRRFRNEVYRLYVSTAPTLEVTDLQSSQEFWHRTACNADGSPLRCRKNGKLKTWITRPSDFRLPVKYGLKTGFYLTPANISEWCVAL